MQTATAKINSAGVNWERPTQDIARDLGLRTSTVSKARAHFAPHTLHKYHPVREDRKCSWMGDNWKGWDAVDWSLPIAELRKTYGMPKSTLLMRKAAYEAKT